MNIIKPYYRFEKRDGYRGNLAVVEAAGRTCYKSDMGNAEKFVSGCVKRGHESVLEHGDYIFETNLDLAYEVRYNIEQLPVKPMIVVVPNRDEDGGIISGNIRAWRDYIRSGFRPSRLFARYIDEIYLSDLNTMDAVRRTSDFVRQLSYEDLIGAKEMMLHRRETVRFIIDRGISHEFVRHRKFSFSQESTRYCNYSKDKFDNQITVIDPCFLKQGTVGYEAWMDACQYAERQYFRMLEFGCMPEEARSVLPNSLKTELVMTGTLGEWKHFFDLRALNKFGKAHPQAVEVAKPLYEEFRRKYPNVFTEAAE